MLFGTLGVLVLFALLSERSRDRAENRELRRTVQQATAAAQRASRAASRAESEVARLTLALTRERRVVRASGPARAPAPVHFMADFRRFGDAAALGAGERRVEGIALWTRTMADHGDEGPDWRPARSGQPELRAASPIVLGRPSEQDPEAVAEPIAVTVEAVLVVPWEATGTFRVRLFLPAGATVREGHLCGAELSTPGRDTARTFTRLAADPDDGLTIELPLSGTRGAEPLIVTAACVHPSAHGIAADALDAGRSLAAITLAFEWNLGTTGAFVAVPPGALVRIDAAPEEDGPAGDEVAPTP